MIDIEKTEEFEIEPETCLELRALAAEAARWKAEAELASVRAEMALRAFEEKRASVLEECSEGGEYEVVGPIDVAHFRGRRVRIERSGGVPEADRK